MRFSLVEPQSIFERPLLGPAALIAACRTAGIDTTLVAGQTRLLRTVLADDVDLTIEAIRAAAALPPETVMQRYHERVPAPRFLENFSIPYLFHLFEVLRQGGEDGLRDYLDALHLRLTSNRIQDKIGGEAWHPHTAAANVLRLCYRHELARPDDEAAAATRGVLARTVDAILATDPDAVGFSMTYIADGFDPTVSAFTYRVIDELQRRHGAPVVIGGPESPFLRVSFYERLFHRRPGVDYCVVGEGDRALPRLLAAIDGGRVEAMPGVLFRQGHEIVWGGAPEAVDIAELPAPDFSQHDLDAYGNVERILPVQITRGCTWRRCAFCTHHRLYRGRCSATSGEQAARRLGALREAYGARVFILNDEEIPAPLARELSQALVRDGQEVYLQAHARLDDRFDRELLELMYEGGFRFVNWGLESGSQRVLDSMCKGIRTDTAARILADAGEIGFFNKVFIFFGFPTETRDEARETLAFLHAHRRDIHYLTFGPFRLTDFSPVARRPEKWGVEITGTDFEYVHSYAVSTGMDAAEVDDFLREVDLVERDLWNSESHRSAGHFHPTYHYVFWLRGLLAPDEARAALASGASEGDGDGAHAGAGPAAASGAHAGLELTPAPCARRGRLVPVCTVRPLRVMWRRFFEVERHRLLPYEGDEMDFDVFTLCDGERTVEQVAWQLLRQQAGAVAGYAQAMEHVARALGRGLDNEWVAVFDPGQGNGAAGDQACSHAAREA